MALSFECMQYFARKPLDTADIVRDGDFSPTEKIAYQFAVYFLFADHA